MAYEDDDTDYTPPANDEGNLQTVEAPSWAEDVAPSQADDAGATEAVAQYQPEAEDESIPENARWRSGQLQDADAPPWAKDLKDADAPPWAANLKDADAPPWAKNVEPDTSIGGTIWRGVKHSLGGAGGVVGGAYAGGAAGSVLGPIGTVGGAIVGGIVGGIVGDVAQHTVEDKLGVGEDPAQVAADQRAHPYIKAAAETAPYAATMGVGAVPAIVRAAGVGVLGAVDVAQQAYQKGGFSDIDPLEVGIRAAPGAMGGFNRAAAKVGEPIAQAVGRAAGASEKQIGETVAGLAANAGRPSEKPATPAMEDAKTVPEATRTQGVAAEQTPGKPGDPTEAGGGFQVTRDGPGPTDYRKGAPVAEEGKSPFTESDPATDAAIKEALGTEPKAAPEAVARAPEPAPAAPEPEPMSRAAQAPPPRMTVGDQLKAQRREQLDAMQRQGRQGQELEQGPKPWRQELVERGMKPEDVKRMSPAEVERAYYNEPATQYAQQTGSRFQPPNRPAGELIKKGEPISEAKRQVAENAKAEEEIKAARFTDEPKMTLMGRLQRVLMPGSMSEAGRLGSMVKRGALGEAQRFHDQQIARITNDMHRAFNQKTPEEQAMLVNRAQGGDHFPNYKPSESDQRLIDAMKAGYKDARAKLEKMPEHEQMRFIENYMPGGIEGDKDKLRNFFQGWNKKGSEGFTKEKLFPTDEDIRNAGFAPKDPNPITRYMKYMENFRHHESTVAMQRELVNRDLGRYANPGEQPAHWDRVEPFSDKNTGKGMYAPRDLAAVINHFYADGLRNAYTKDFYDLARRSQNMYTALELGLSPYHAFTEIGEAVSSGFARALDRLMTGDVKGAAESFAKAPAKFITYAKEGARLRALRKQDPSTWPAADRPVLEAMTRANIKPEGMQHTPDYELSRHGADLVDTYLKGSWKQDSRAIMDQLWGKNGWPAAARVPIDLAQRLMQTTMRPVFQHYIPALKMGAQAEHIRDFLRANPNISGDARQIAINRIVDTYDNRMGEMIRDNMSMRAGIQQAGYLALRSFSWTIGGAIKEVGGGALSLARGALKGENRLNMASPAYDPRAAYPIAFAFTVALMDGLYQALKTGEAPKEWRDLAYPKTGGHVYSAGKTVDERLQMPGYHKDIFGYLYHPKEEIKNKIAGLWSAIGDQVTGTDWKGDPIVNPKSSGIDQLKQRLMHAAYGVQPISFKSFEEGKKKGTGITDVEKGLGFRAPGGWMLNPEGTEKGAQGRAEKAWKEKERKERSMKSHLQ